MEYKIEQDTKVILPIGLDRDGKRYREVIIDEWRGKDSEALTAKTSQKNPSRAMTQILCRLVQEIPGLMPPKSDILSRCAEHWLQEMHTADRDTLLFQALALSDFENAGKEIEVTCPHCQAEGVEHVYLTNIPVRHLADDLEPNVTVQLPRGVKRTYTDAEGVSQTKVYKQGKLAYGTGKDHEAISKYAEQGEMVLFSKLLLRTLSLEGEKLDSRDIDLMSLADRNYLQKIASDEAPGPNAVLDMTCHACGKEFKEGLNVASFFM